MAESVLLNDEERFKIALKDSSISIFNCDLNLVYTWAFNPPSSFTAADFSGKTDDEVFLPFEAAQLIELKKWTLVTGSRQQAVIALSLPEEERNYEFTVEPIRSTTDTVIGLAITGVDITARVAAERRQRRANDEAKLAEMTKIRFLSSMSHEVRTPLGVIEGFAELAADPHLNEVDRQEYLRAVKRNAENISYLLDEILNLSKIATRARESINDDGGIVKPQAYPAKPSSWPARVPAGDKSDQRTR